LTLELAPIRFVPDGLSPTDPVGSTALGLSWNVEPVIAAVEESTLQSEHDRPAIGDRVTGVELVNCEPLPLRKNSFSAKTNDGGFFFHSIGNRVDMPYIFAYLLQETQPRNFKTGEEKKPLAVRLTLESPNGDLKTALLPITESTDWFHLERGFVLKPDLALFKAAGWGDALVSGTAKTIEFSLLVYTSLNSLINGTVSPKALHGPVGIVEIMYKIAQGPWSEFLMLLCLVGANLAVVNLLPIPPLDGGHVLFLTYEGIFRRPPNELVQVILSYFGLFLIVLLLVWTVSLDLSCIPRW
jgi:regulator of sigma E protease